MSLSLAEELLVHLATPDRRAAMEHASGLISSGRTLDSLIDEGLAPAMRQVGHLWESAVWTVTDEHLATAAAEAALNGAINNAPRDPRARGELVVSCVEGDWHSLPPRMIADSLDSHGWSVRFLGASQPTQVLLEHLQRHRPRAVLLGCAVPMALPTLAVAVAGVRDLDLPVYLGGRAVTAERARTLGADGWAPSAQAAVELMEDLDTLPIAPGPRLDASRHVAREGSFDSWAQRAMDDLERRMPSMAAFPPAVMTRTRADLRHLIDMASTAELLQDPTLLAEQHAWLGRVLAARGVPAAALAHGMAALVQTAPRSAQLAPLVTLLADEALCCQSVSE